MRVEIDIKQMKDSTGTNPKGTNDLCSFVFASLKFEETKICQAQGYQVKHDIDNVSDFIYDWVSSSFQHSPRYLS